MEIPNFKAKVWKQGDSFILTIPKGFANKHKIKLGTTFRVGLIRDELFN